VAEDTTEITISRRFMATPAGEKATGDGHRWEGARSEGEAQALAVAAEHMVAVGEAGTDDRSILVAGVATPGQFNKRS
jgi:hypothetical protein